MNEPVKGKIHFPNLDGLRFYMALFVIIIHIESIKYQGGREVIKSIYYFQPLAFLDVCLFFVLSGFLITYLLMAEKRETGNINYKSYFKRRSLRIWPLHYLILALGFFVLPFLFNFISKSNHENMHHNFWVNLVGCMLFLSPIALITGRIPPVIGPIWSVGVEEVF